MPKNTLFNYFAKSPPSKCVKKSTENLTNVVENQSLNDRTQESTHLAKKNRFKQGDVVWAKCQNSAWWPAFVCDEATSQSYVQHEGNNVTKVYVRFVNKTLQQAWIYIADIKSFQGLFEIEKDSQFYSTSPHLHDAAKLAEETLRVAANKRIGMLEAWLCCIDANDMKEAILSESENVDPGIKLKAEAIKEENVQTKSSSGRSIKKYRRIIESDDEIEDSGGDDDYKPVSVKTNRRALSSDESDDYPSEPEDDKPVKTGTKRKRCNNEIVKSVPNVTAVKSKLLSFQSNDSQVVSTSESSNTYLHETLGFLYPTKIMDANGNCPTNPNYDKTTLKVPQDFLAKQTPAMYQWWTIKSKHFDVVLFFKVGKFYELYHMDAVVGVKELGLIYMKGNFAHSGFPEIAFGRYSAALVQKGYTVARVEQTETPEQNSQRIKGRSLPKYEKTLRREVCRITTKGTQIYNMWNEGNVHNHESNLLLAVSERMVNNGNVVGGQATCREIGICFVDTSIGVFHLGQFHDDRSCSQFRTLISHNFPCQVLYEKGKQSAELEKIFHTGLASVIQNGLVAGSQFWDSTKTLKSLSEGRYFVKNDEETWSDVLQMMKSSTDPLGRTAKSEYELAISALGACVFYLKKCLIDFEVVSMNQFQHYCCEEKEEVNSTSVISSFPASHQRLILDSSSLSNLELLHNCKGTSDGSLLARLDQCKTPFGRRLLKQWMCSPLCNPTHINSRLDAIDDLLLNNVVADSLSSTLTRMPDLERMLAQIHTMSKGSRNDDHPDYRAIMYEEQKYSKKKINDFMSILENYESVYDCLKSLQEHVNTLKSTLLQGILCLTSNSGSGSSFPDMGPTLSRWKKAFNHKKAKETGKIIPNTGTNPEYDQAMRDIETISNEAEQYLREQKKELHCSKIKYKGVGNKRFQLEIPLDDMMRRVSDDYEISGQRKGFKSFRTDVTKELVKKIEEAEARRDAAQADSMAIIFREFSKDYAMWKAAIDCLAQADVLISLARFSKGADGTMCRPEVIVNQDSSPMLDIREARHPCITKTFYDDVFIPNDTLLGCSNDDSSSATCLLLTGPNMGGKSTLMRQVGLLVVLAQMGCYVPARSCKITPCDRIFTRLGAFDRIMAGESTFFVELSETSSILKHATTNSLVLLDELGRGTSTYDGTAIASAVLQEISQRIGCRTIFSTHYRTLVDDVLADNNVQLGHMACMVEDGDEDVEETLTFLYKLAAGSCPKSYGFHAASLAGVSEDIVKLAKLKAAELETNKNNMAAFRRVFDTEEIDLPSLIAL